MKRIVIFLVVTFGLTWTYEFGVVYPLANGELDSIPPVMTQLVVGAVMLFPAIGVVITRIVTREGFKNSVIKPRAFRQSFPWFLVAWFGPPILFALGGVVYFLFFSQDFDPSMSAMITTQQDAAMQSGISTEGVTPDALRLALIAQIAVALALGPVLNAITAFGEEWGWRGYLVPKMATRFGIVPNLLITGVIWGLWHAPLTVIGHNYGTGYVGWPLLGIIAMCVFCIVLGIFLTYVTVRTGSCLAAVIGHGAANSIVSVALLFSATGGNPFIGPSSTGILGGSVAIIVAALMLGDLRRREKANTLSMPQAGLPDGERKGDTTQADTPAIP